MESGTEFSLQVLAESCRIKLEEAGITAENVDAVSYYASESYARKNMMSHIQNIEYYLQEDRRMYVGTDETIELWKEVHPWMKGAILRPDAPEEIKEKFERVLRLMDEEEEKQIRMM